MNTKQSRTAHYVSHWGVPQDIHIRESIDSFDFAILEFPPRKNRKTWRFATNGMSEVLQIGESFTTRTELYVCSQYKDEWCIDLLDKLARYPKHFETYFGEFDTLEFERSDSRFSGIMLAPPEPEDPDECGFISQLFPDQILIYRIVCLFPEELEFAISHGGEALWSRLLALGVPLLTDVDRPMALCDHH